MSSTTAACPSCCISCVEWAGVRDRMLQKMEAKELAEQAAREMAASAQGISVWNQVRPWLIKGLRRSLPGY